MNIDKKENSANPERIKIELRYGDHYSYYVDANGLLKGEWGGFNHLDIEGPNGESMYEIYYNHFDRRIPINEFGLFYNKFSCKKYDGILKLAGFNLFLCEKNNRWGVIDEQGKDILHTSFNEILPFYKCFCSGYGTRYLYLLSEYEFQETEYKNSLFFIVTTETGKFLFNLDKGVQSVIYDDIFCSGWNSHSQIICKYGEKYGVLDDYGSVLLNPCLDYHHGLFYNYSNKNFEVWINDNMFYGKIPITDYDLCIKVNCFRHGDNSFYISKKENKFGLLSDKGKIISDVIFDEIILYKRKSSFSASGLSINNIGIDLQNGIKWINANYVIARKGALFSLYNVQNGHTVLNDCDSIEYTKFAEVGKKHIYDYIVFTKNTIRGYVLWNENIVDTKEYEEIEADVMFIYVKKNGKWGVLKTSGIELLPCIYDYIKVSSYGEYTAIKEGKEESGDIFNKQDSASNSSYERPTFERYVGTYAQEEMGFSDDDIDTIFDGDPSAYWNID